MNEEYEWIMKNDVWDVVPRPKDKSVVTSKWLYKIKHGVDGSVEKFQGQVCCSRLLSKGRLNKALYGLKQAPRAWYERNDSYVMKLGFTRSEVDLNLYFKVENNRPLILVSYVDDLFLTGANPLIYQCKRELASEFQMKDLGLMYYFLGLEVWKKPGEIFLSQGKYIVKLVERFGVVDCKSVTTPMKLNFKKLCGSVARSDLGNPSKYHQLVGALMFLVNSRLNICFEMNTLSQFMVKPHHIDWVAAKNLLRYLRGTITYGLRYTVGNLRLHGYSDVD
eukprot:PITA_30145